MVPFTFVCPCDSKKEHKLVFDGGILGHYSLDLCTSCYFTINKKFLISVETIPEEYESTENISCLKKHRIKKLDLQEV